MVEHHDFGLRSKGDIKEKRKLLFIFILMTALLVGASIVFADKLNFISSNSEYNYTRCRESYRRRSKEIIENAKPINVLLLGIDNGAYGRPVEDGRSDTMLLLTANPSEKKSSIIKYSS